MDFNTAIHQCTPKHVSVETMAKVITVESTKRENAIGYKVVRSDGSVFFLTAQPKNKSEAIAWATWFEKQGFKYDAGPAQVNSSNFARLGLTPATVFDLCSNIKAGATVLSECYDKAYKKSKNEQLAVRQALSCYQSGNFKTGFLTGYVAKVVQAESPIKGNENHRGQLNNGAAARD